MNVAEFMRGSVCMYVCVCVWAHMNSSVWFYLFNNLLFGNYSEENRTIFLWGKLGVIAINESLDKLSYIYIYMYIYIQLIDKKYERIIQS